LEVQAFTYHLSCNSLVTIKLIFQLFFHKTLFFFIKHQHFSVRRKLDIKDELFLALLL